MLGSTTSYLVVLNLGMGNWQQGFVTVTAQLWEETRPTPMQFIGSLPAAPELERLFEQWRSLYASHYAHLNWRGSSLRSTALDEFEVEDSAPSYFSQTEFDDCCRTLQQQINQWLNAEAFRPIERQLRTRLSPDDQIRIMIVAQDANLLRLPWNLWNFLTDYPQAEIALSPPEYARSPQTLRSPAQKVRILAIIGNSTGINVTRDQAYLNQLPNTQIDWLIEPGRQQLNEQLWQTGYDVLFFAGHSSTSAQSTQGYLHLNAQERLSIDQLKYGLRTAIAQGLKLAIFNSCDGLGLAHALAELYVPQVIVMREPVPDRVAQVFLKAFLTEFTRGQSLYLAVRHAREQLQAIELEFPCATWLPVICQNPAELPPRWQDWCTAPQQRSLFPSRFPSRLPSRLPSRKEWQVLLLSSVVMASGVIGLRGLGGLQPLELWAFDRLLRLRPAEEPDNRLLIVRVTEADIRAQGSAPREASLADATLNPLLAKLEQHQPLAIGLDIYRDFAATLPSLADRLRNSDRLIPICKRLDIEHDPDGILPPPEVPPERIGFSDFVQDRDRAIRRQVLFFSANTPSPCAAPYAFSTQLAFRYLDAQGISPSFTPTGDLQFNQPNQPSKQTVIPRITDRTSGYQGIDARGSQILLNYRATPTLDAIAPQLTVTQLLQGDFNPSIIQNRIVLIGVTVPNRGDYWITPYGDRIEQRLPGVLIHAQMISQILSTVLDDRPLLWTWSFPIEILWITTWAFIGSAIVWQVRHPLWCILLLSGTILLCITISFTLLLQGGWIPLIPPILVLMLTSSAVLYFFKPTELSG
ncbi:MAG: CHASE2 domain-containing protein [Oculatellaceae cyanobacterium Prado106]|jgi:CHASE2 domain-containing sensor protein|nr:CHASE2 domain-containing protein [Oculatellaceae cyanobacterium Prado106]